MKTGIVVRSEDRGLGNLSRSFHDNLHLDRTLVVIPAGRHGLTAHLDWYPDATHVRYNGALNERICREWLNGLDVVLGFETMYDWKFCRWARQVNCATVCMAMPEWWRNQWADLPTRWWAPTTWRIDQLPAGTLHVPVPLSEPPGSVVGTAGPFRWLHIAGAHIPDWHDRNGTGAVYQAAEHLTADQEIVVRTQSPLPPAPDGVTVVYESLASRWDLYRDVDALVLPRRYAGLSLPVLEALACGLPVLMTDLSPQNTDWPVATVPTKPGTPIRILNRDIDTGDADVRSLAHQMDLWATDRAIPAYWASRARVWAEANSWTVRAPEIRAELEQVALVTV